MRVQSGFKEIKKGDYFYEPEKPDTGTGTDKPGFMPLHYQLYTASHASVTDNTIIHPICYTTPFTTRAGRVGNSYTQHGR
jgi:hypothetical protein